MKKTIVALSIAALIALVLGVTLLIVGPLLVSAGYDLATFFAGSWTQVYAWFSFLSNPSWDFLRIIMLVLIFVLGIVVPVIWIILMVKYNKGKSALVLILWFLVLIVTVFDVAFLLGTPNFLATILATADVLAMITLWATHALIALAFVLTLIAGIINMIYCANAPTPPKRTFANAQGSDERLVLIREEPQPNGPSADEIREVLHEELEAAPTPAKAPEAPQSPV
ncbi:MAG: hypothetical protein WC282_02765, partial [Bacilli bacterium]